MEIGVVVHGPGIVDSGWAKKIIDILSNFGNVHCRLGGTMGRTAVIDAGLEDVIDISLKLLPSQSLELYNREHADVIFLLNYGKSAETGQVFGYNVFSHYFKQLSNEDYLATNHKSLYESRILIIQIERPGEPDGSIISWNYTLNEQLEKRRNSKRAKLGLGKDNMVDSLTFNFEEFFEGLKAALDLTEVAPEDVVAKYLSNNEEMQEEQNIERMLESYEDYSSSHYTYRKIHGVSEGENIFINGIVVGYSNADSIVLVARNGILVDIINGTMKYHGVEKLGPVDLDRVIVKTGLLRKSSDVNPRILSKNDVFISDTERLMYSEEISDDDYSFKVAYVDHAAYDIYKFKDFDLVVTVGDDTSLVASDILYRLNIPIIGITDGDLDKVVEEGFVNEKSTFLEVASGFDDIVGHYIHEEIFFSKDTLEIPFKEGEESVEEFKSIMLKVFKSRVVEKVTNVVPSFVEKDYNNNVINSCHEVIDGNQELVDVLDDFIDGFEDEIYEEEDDIYFDEHLDSDEVYLDGDLDSQVDEIYVEPDLEEMSDAELEEIIVEHGSDDYGEVYIVEDDSVVYVDDYPVEVEYSEDIHEDELYYDEVPIGDPVNDSPVEEIYVEHDVHEETVYVDVPEQAALEDSPVEEIYVEHDVHEEIIYEDVPVEEVFIEEPVDDINADDSVEEIANEDSADEEIDDEDGWGEYIEEEFGDSLNESDESKDSN